MFADAPGGEPPVITTVIPTFRRPQLLRRALRSVLCQSMRRLVAAVYDNASGDDTEAVVGAIAAADRRVRYVRRPQNIGAFANFADGMARVETPYLAMLSDDDVLLPHLYERALAMFERHPAAAMVALSALEFDEAGRFAYEPLARWRRDGLFEPPAAMFEMLDNKHPTWTAVVFRTSVLAQDGPLDPAVGMPSDLDFELRVAAHHPVVVSFEAGALYVRHAAAASAVEDVAIIADYETMRGKFRSDPRLSDVDRARMDARLKAQAANKLIEIAGKAIVGRRFDVAERAATLLDGGYGRHALATAFRIAAAASRRFPMVGSALEAVERTRLRARARATRASSEQLAAYAALLAPARHEDGVSASA